MELIFGWDFTVENCRQRGMKTQEDGRRRRGVLVSWINLTPQNWSRVVQMFSYPFEIRRAMYTTNTIESLNAARRKVSKKRLVFPNDEAVFKLMYLALRNISKR